MRDTPWHARPRAPEPPSATQPAPQQTTFRRLVIVNQELAQHNAKLRQDLADARRRATVAANAEAQAGIVVAMHREKQAEAARLRRELLTSLGEAREEIRGLRIQVDAQASLLRLQRALRLSPANRSTGKNAYASPAASTTSRRSFRESLPKQNASAPPSPEPWSPIRGVSNTLLLHVPSVSENASACASRQSPTNAEPTMPPPATSGAPRVNLRGFAARETATPGEATRPPTRGKKNVQTSAGSEPPPTSTPRRALRHRHKPVVYTEPSLKTKMRRPRTPPHAARAPASVAVEANPVFSGGEKNPPSRETVGTAAEADGGDDGNDETGKNEDDSDASSSESEVSTTPLAFVTSRRRRRKSRAVRISPDS